MDLKAKKRTIIKRVYEPIPAARVSRADRRELLEEAAAKVFARYGFCGATTKEIAARAGVSEASLFQYFSSKAELYAAVLARKTKNPCAERLDEINELAARDDDENLFLTVAAVIAEQCRRDSEFMRLMLYSALEGHAEARLFYESRTNHLAQILARYIERRQREKAFQMCDSQAVAHGFIGAQIHCAMTNLLSNEDFENASPNNPIADFTRLTLDGLRAGATGRKKYTGIF